MPPTSVIVLVAIALVFSFLNGAKDGASTLATLVTSRAMAPGWALGLVGLAEFAGPFIFGVAVARTIGAGVVEAGDINVLVVIGGLLSATLWNIITWWLALPTSSSHALVGGLVGAVVVHSGFSFQNLHTAGLIKIALGLFLAPLVSMALSYLITHLMTFLFRNASPRINWFFKRSQLLTTLGLALSHGANDAPKAMGMISLGLVTVGLLPSFAVPFWVSIAAVTAVTAGTVLGSRRVMRTVGTRFYRVRPFHALNSQLAAAALIIGASLTGAPASTSQVVSSAIVGTGAAARLTMVRWSVLSEIVAGWLFTIPATMVAGGLVYWLLQLGFGQ